MNSDVKPILMNLYPVMDSPTEAIKYAESKVPVETPNEMFTLLMIYHNSLLAQIARDSVTTCKPQGSTFENHLNEVTRAACDEGYAITWWSPEDLEGVDADRLVDFLIESGDGFIDDTRTGS